MAKSTEKREEDKKEINVQSLFNAYVDDSHRKTYVIDIPGKHHARIYTTSHTMFTTLLTTEYLRRAEAVKTQGQEAHYEITPYKGLHVGTNRGAYKGSEQNYNYLTGVLYKSILPNTEGPDHQTLILSDDPQYQVDCIPFVVSGHCCTYNIHPGRGHLESEIPMLSAESCLDPGVQGPEFTAYNRTSIMSMSRVFTFNMQEAVNEWAPSENPVDPYLAATQAGVTAMQAIKNPPTFEEE